MPNGFFNNINIRIIKMQVYSKKYTYNIYNQIQIYTYIKKY